MPLAATLRRRISMWCRPLILAAAVLAPATGRAADAKPKPVAGKADVLKRVPKKFATFQSFAAAKNHVRLLVEGDDAPTDWRVNPDAEIKVHGWWGRLTQFSAGRRVWVWFDVDRRGRPTGVLMLADEPTEKDIHGTADPAALAPLRQKQRQFLRSVWRKDGLPGTVSFLHKLGGECELMLDHEAIRWGRYLKEGDAVTIATPNPISAAVKFVRPWRERTLVRLVPKSTVALADLSPGERIRLKVPEPPADVQQSEEPTDIGRQRTRGERIEWFLATVYCTCKVKGDRCTGMFYTQASCNVNACGMPNNIARTIGRLIDQGKSDREVLAELQKSRGQTLLKPHLLK